MTKDELKKERISNAQAHVIQMQNTYYKEISKAVLNTHVYDDSFKEAKELQDVPTMEIELVAEDSVSAIFNHSEGKTAVLNFASYKNPGGQYLNGSMAQEEALCDSSFLYNVLSQKGSYYAWNNAHKNKALYTNRALYTQDVLFFNKNNGSTQLCDVITCAAPNRTASRRYNMASDVENNKALVERILFVLNIAVDQKVETLILGAYGCGVFGQKAETVATIFKHYLRNTHKCFKKVIFAIPDGESQNYKDFDKMLTRRVRKVNEQPTSLF